MQRRRQVFWLKGHRIRSLPSPKASDIFASAILIQRRLRTGFTPVSFFTVSLETDQRPYVIDVFSDNQIE